MQGLAAAAGDQARLFVIRRPPVLLSNITQLLSRHICQTLLRGHGDKNALFALSSILRTRPPDWLGMAARLLILMAISAMVSPQPRPRVIGCLDYPFSR